jgi:hypothetical protein
MIAAAAGADEALNDSPESEIETISGDRDRRKIAAILT